MGEVVDLSFYKATKQRVHPDDVLERLGAGEDEDEDELCESCLPYGECLGLEDEDEELMHSPSPRRVPPRAPTRAPIPFPRTKPRRHRKWFGAIVLGWLIGQRVRWQS